jgi:Holliday junction resolvase RusA-like endonuclease
MTRAELLKIAPNSSEGFIAANTSQDALAGRTARKKVLSEKPCVALIDMNGFVENYTPNPARFQFENGEWVRVFPEEETCSTIKANPDYQTVPKEAALEIIVSGQVRGGKNNMIVLRSGIHIPKKEWAKWRDQKVAEVKAQLPKGWMPIDKPTNFSLKYVAGDKRRRDLPAILDSLYHVLEKAGVVADDTFLWMTLSSRDYDKENPRAELTIYLP